MDRYRKKPLVIDAVQWDGTAQGAAPIIDRILRSDGKAVYLCADPERCAEHDGDAPHTIRISTLEGDMSASVGDWIIRGVHGEFYPCKPQVFAATYEPLHEPAETAEIGLLSLTPDGVFIDGAPLLVAGEPIRVETVAEDLHIVHVGLFVRQVTHDPLIDVETVRTFRPPVNPIPSSTEAPVGASTFRDHLPPAAEQAPGDGPLMNAFTRALELANTQGSATVGYRNGDGDTETGYDVTITRFGPGAPASAQTTLEPAVGRIVLYTLSQFDADAINKRRSDFHAFTQTLASKPQPGHRGATGHVAHVGNDVTAGTVCAAVIVQVWGGPAANLQVLLDGSDTYWATSRTEGTGQGRWIWPPQD